MGYSLCLIVAAALITTVRPCTAWAQSRTTSVEAGPIWNQADAETKCPNVAKANGGVWNGQWRTTVPGQMSICVLAFRQSSGKDVTEAIEAGPIWNQMDAEKKCPEVAKTNGGAWNGRWRTTVPGRMSVCEIRLQVIPAR